MDSLGLSRAPAGGTKQVEKLVGEAAEGPQEAVAIQVVQGGLAEGRLAQVLDAPPRPRPLHCTPSRGWGVDSGGTFVRIPASSCPEQTLRPRRQR